MLIGVVDAVGPDSPLGLSVGAAGCHPRLADPHPAADHRRPGRLGRPVRAGRRPRGRRSSSPARSPPCCPTTCPTPSPWRSSTSAARRRRPPGWSSGPGRARSSSSARPASPAACRLAAARAAGATELTGLVRNEAEAAALRAAGLADRVVVADATDPLAVAAAVATPADVTVVCVDVPGRRARRRPRDGRRGHRGLLLHGHLLPGGGPGRGGDGGGRDDAGGQRLHAGPRRPGPGPVPLARRACARSSTRASTA